MGVKDPVLRYWFARAYLGWLRQYDQLSLFEDLA